MGRTPAHEGVWPVKLNHADSDSVGVAEVGSIAATSVEDFMWCHQKEAGRFDLTKLARMSRAIVRHWRTYTPFCRGACGEMVVSRVPFASRKPRICFEVRSPALSVCMRRSFT
eukprot:4451932-Pleurochrysis_carterae.AAC.1